MPSVQKRPGTVELLFASAAKMGLKPEWITPNGLFVVTTPNGEYFINHERSSLNSHVSISLAKNKYHTRAVLERHGLPNIPYARVKTLVEAQKFLAMQGVIIAKPLKGNGSVGISIVRQPSQLTSLRIADYILEKYMPGNELRYLVMGGEVIGVHESRYGTSVASDRYLERISYDVADWDPALLTMSLEIAKILGLSFAAVDFIISADNEPYVLEVNSRPGFKWFHAPSEGPVVDVATKFLEAMIAG